MTGRDTDPGSGNGSGHRSGNAAPSRGRAGAGTGTGSGPGNGERDESRNRDRSPDETDLLLDVMLGKLATYLRMCGYDAAYAVERGTEADDALRSQAGEEDRLLVSRDEALVRRTDDAVLVRSRGITDQLVELREAGFWLELASHPTYCSACNGDLEAVDRTEPTPDYAPEPDDRDVWRCGDCGQHFWYSGTTVCKHPLDSFRDSVSL